MRSPAAHAEKQFGFFFVFFLFVAFVGFVTFVPKAVGA
jgi:hypothetical protein